MIFLSISRPCDAWFARDVPKNWERFAIHQPSRGAQNDGASSGAFNLMCICIYFFRKDTSSWKM